MPELPEIYRMSRLINNHCGDKKFVSVIKSSVSKNPELTIPFKLFNIKSQSRGKEIVLTIQNDEKNDSEADTIYILFGMGMSGHWRFLLNGNEIPKNTHLRFVTNEDHNLCFIDPRRFGRWSIGKWGEDRGPDPITEHDAFCKNINDNIEKKIFETPICELLLNQDYFNGIGNYLRAEIIHRAKVPPYMSAREAIQIKQEGVKTVLELCHDLPLEVINLDADVDYATKENYHIFENWLQVYGKKKSKTLVDKFKRKIWFVGDSGLKNEKKKDADDEENIDVDSADEFENPIPKDKGKAKKGKDKAKTENSDDDNLSKPKKTRKRKSKEKVIEKGDQDAAENSSSGSDFEVKRPKKKASKST